MRSARLFAPGVFCVVDRRNVTSRAIQPCMQWKILKDLLWYFKVLKLSGRTNSGPTAPTTAEHDCFPCGENVFIYYMDYCGFMTLWFYKYICIHAVICCICQVRVVRFCVSCFSFLFSFSSLLCLNRKSRVRLLPAQPQPQAWGW